MVDRGRNTVEGTDYVCARTSSFTQSSVWEVTGLEGPTVAVSRSKPDVAIKLLSHERSPSQMRRAT
jgi:hypothetical protein